MRRVIVLRPEPGASETMRKAGERGLDAAVVPLFKVEPVPWEAPEPRQFDALLLTSANAVRHAGDKLAELLSLPVHSVGRATAAAARSAGFHVASVGNGGVDDALASLATDLKLLHLCGADRMPPGDARQEIAFITVYRSRQETAADLSAAEGAVVLVHSPRAARRFAELVRERGATAIAAISPAAAAAVGSGWESVEVAEAPNDEALLALAKRLCNKPRE